MPKTTSSKKRKSGAKKPGAIAVVRLYAPSKKQISVEQLDQPPTIERPKKIHPRHLLPLVKEGEERNVHSLSKEAIIRPQALGPMAASDEVTLAKNTELTAPGKQKTASNVGEPSVAINGNVVFYTGNWYAAVSSDGGTTFKFINPGTQFPNPAPNAQFCCDQIVHYISKIDTFVWLLQYGPEDGDNIQRLAFAKTADVVKGKWRLFDITTKILKVEGAFLDFPDISVGANNLYVTTNIFAPANKVGSAVIRIPFSGIESGQVTAQPFVSMSLQSFRIAQNCGTTAFFAAHQNTSTLAVFTWREGQSAPVQKLVPVARWIGGNGYISRLPDGRRWLDRADPRITGATLVKKDLWFAWTVDRRSNQRAQPFVQIARIDSTNLTLLENINIFDPTSAIAYGTLSTNSNDEVGVSYMIGGAFPPSHIVGILTGTRKNVMAAKGERGPLDADGNGEWGDYLAVRRVFPNQKLFAATGYTMKGKGDGSNRDVTPRFVVFGRAGDVKAAGITPAPPGPGPDPTPGPEPAPDPTPVVGGVVGAPFKDVNALPTVSAAVAAQIKAAAMSEGQSDFPEMAAVGVGLKLVTKPGVERWPVKTGTDDDVALVGKNIINGMSLGTGIVEATVEELVLIPRPTDMRPVDRLFPRFQEKRRGPVEMVVWRLEGDLIAVKQEGDGDLHLIVQGASGQTMIAEAPTPRPPFVDASCPWTSNLNVARKAIDDRIVKKLSPANFVLMDDMLVPRESLPPSLHPQAMAMTPPIVQSFALAEADDAAPVPTFMAKLKPIACRITGVGFFDKVHGQMGVSQFNGIELHPILKIEFL
ncbi:MAG: hypothetical protein AABO41_12685 [Acidobacteriota bacterium]